MRTRTRSLSWSVAISGIALALIPTTAYAQYLDPGAGSIIVQSVIAVAIGTTAAIKIYWRRIAALLSRWRKKD
jgi:NAD/NADP transhydrogenase beta subunit